MKLARVLLTATVFTGFPLSLAVVTSGCGDSGTEVAPVNTPEAKAEKSKTEEFYKQKMQSKTR